MGSMGLIWTWSAHSSSRPTPFIHSNPTWIVKHIFPYPPLAPVLCPTTSIHRLLTNQPYLMSRGRVGRVQRILTRGYAGGFGSPTVLFPRVRRRRLCPHRIQGPNRWRSRSDCGIVHYPDNVVSDRWKPSARRLMFWAIQWDQYYPVALSQATAMGNSLIVSLSLHLITSIWAHYALQIMAASKKKSTWKVSTPRIIILFEIHIPMVRLTIYLMSQGGLFGIYKLPTSRSNREIYKKRKKQQKQTPFSFNKNKTMWELGFCWILLVFGKNHLPKPKPLYLMLYPLPRTFIFSKLQHNEFNRLI